MAREMKDSGVAWIGEIPADWQIVKFSRIASVKCNLVAPDDYLDLPQISPESIEKGSGKLLSYKTVEEAGIISGNHLFHEGQLLYSKIRPKLNKVCIAPFSGLCSADMYPIESNQNIRFLMYCMLSDAFVGQVSMITEDRVKMPKINQDELSSLLLAFPPTHSEQQVIANFLDTKCTEIDAVLEKTRVSIEEYKKLKQAIITQAVTKGVRGDRPMKASGIEWANLIPLEWESINPKALFSQRKEKAAPGERQLTSSQKYGIVYQDDYMELTGSRVVVVQKDFDILKHVEAGDFIISMRSFQGGLEYSTKTGSISSAYVMLIPNLNLVYPRFYRWLLKSEVYIRALQRTSNMVRDGQAMRYSNFAQVRLYTVPLQEQMEIADYLDEKCAMLDALIEKKEKFVSEIESYKKSFIYEYITGKRGISL